MLHDQIIEPGTLTTDGERLSVSVRIPWYRSLPLSSITGVSLNVDGFAVPREQLTWQTEDGGSYTLDELTKRWDRWWFVLDSARISGPLPSLPATENHDVDVTIGLHIPYLPAGDGVIAIAERDRKTMHMEVLT